MVSDAASVQSAAVASIVEVSHPFEPGACAAVASVGE